jgi:hypothetical protein
MRFELSEVPIAHHDVVRFAGTSSPPTAALRWPRASTSRPSPTTAACVEVVGFLEP